MYVNFLDLISPPITPYVYPPYLEHPNPNPNPITLTLTLTL